MREWKCKQVVDFDKSTTTVKEERNKTLQQQTTDKYLRFQVVTLPLHVKMILILWGDIFSYLTVEIVLIQ